MTQPALCTNAAAATATVARQRAAARRRRRKIRALWAGATASILLAISAKHVAAQNEEVSWPRVNSEIAPDPAIESQVQHWLSKMTVAQKVGQIVQAEIRDVTPAEVGKFHLGSILNGGGAFPGNRKQASVKDWLALADAFYDASMQADRRHLPIPVIWGTDAVHGHSNVMGATLFPHNIGLGAAHNPLLIQQIGAATAREVAATGIDWTFAPTVAVARNDRWGRTYESYSEHPQTVRDYAGPMVRGLQGDPTTTELFDPYHVVATLKHFVGDGGTLDGIDQGDNPATERRLLSIHAQGYVTGLAAGAQTVMASFNSWRGQKIHGTHYLLTEVLKNRMGFDGLVVGDWNGHGQVPGCTNESCAAAINAGIDLIMVPQDWREFIRQTLRQVHRGEISRARLDDAVARVLRVKLRAGLFDKGRPSERASALNTDLIGSPAHRAIARQAVRESLVLLKNNDALLPLPGNAKLLVTGSGADDIAQQSGGWSLTWQGTENSNTDFPGATSVYAGLRQALALAGGSAELSADASYTSRPDAAVVVFGERPYAEGQGDRMNVDYRSANASDLAVLHALAEDGIPVVSVFLTGRPLWVNPHINASKAFVVAWLPGSEGAGIADVLIGDANGQARHDFSGRLSFSWPAHPQQTSINVGDEDYGPQFAYGYGLSYQDNTELAKLAPRPPAAEVDPAKMRAISVFANRPTSPWNLFAGDAGDWSAAVKSSHFKSANSVVTVKRIDKVVQEDARRYSFNGKSGGQVYLQGAAQDLSRYLQGESALLVALRVDRRPHKQVLLRMGCQYPCRGEVDITDYLRQVPLGEWTTLSLDLKCFADAGAEMRRIDSPFSLFTEGKFGLSTADMSIVPGMAKQALISCRSR